MKHLSTAAVLVVTLFLAVATRAAALDDASAETDKIAKLITHVREMKNTKFVRNGKSYDGGAAADHIQRKYDAVKDQVKTAREFIEKCASKSERSGEAYKIRFDDGKEQTASEYLNAQLDAIEKQVGT